MLRIGFGIVLSLLIMLAIGCSGDHPGGAINGPGDPAALTAGSSNAPTANTALGEAAVPRYQPAGQEVQRPFSDYTSTQGTYCFPDGEGGCIDFEPPMKNFVGWLTHDYSVNGLFEYLGNADAWLQQHSNGAISLGTNISGTVTERPLADGRALIHINLHARNILAWVTRVETYYLDPIIFGSRAVDVLNGAPPSLGDFHLDIEFISPQQHAPIPDLFQLFLDPEPGQEILHVNVDASARGILHQGSGFPEGTLGRVRVVQVYPPLPNSDYSTGWTVEQVELHAVGH